ncbi:spermatogenesis-associated protein 45 [Fundulus diaphanus]
MSGSGEPVLELNMRRESWCRVEADPRGSWERSERRHYRNHLRTGAVLLSALTGRQQRGAACTELRPPVKLPERKHFEQSYTSHLV